MDDSNRDIDIENGIGVFSGPVSESPFGCLVFLIVVTVITGIAIWIPIADHGSVAAFIPAVILSLITIIIAIDTYSSFTRDNKVPDEINVRGMYLTKDEVFIGNQSLELNDKCFIDKLYERKSSEISKAKVFDHVDNTRMNRRDITFVLQIVNSKYNKNYFVIAKIHFYKHKTLLRTINLMIGGKPVLIIDGVLYPVMHITLFNQLKMIYERLNSFQNKEQPICNLLITPRSGIPGSVLFMYGAIGGAIKGIADSIKTSEMREALKKQELFDNETSEFLIELVEKHKCQIELRTLGVNELGLAGSEW